MTPVANTWHTMSHDESVPLLSYVTLVPTFSRSDISNSHAL